MIGEAVETYEEEPGQPDAFLAGELGLITGHLARRAGADTALLAIREPPEGLVEILAAWGIDQPIKSPIPLEDGFVGRAVLSFRAVGEPLDERDRSLGPSESGARLTYAIGAPVRRPGGPDATLCAGFAQAPLDEDTVLWTVASYARLASLCLHDAGALDGLLAAARRDSLTGCLNHAAICQEFAREIRRCTRSGRSVSCCFIDLDRFKQLNDERGHLQGSRVLANVATSLHAGLRHGDTLGRYGGDEFVAVLPDTDEAAAYKLAERLRSNIAATRTDGARDRVGASIGVAEWRPGHSAAWTLALADRSLLAAKAAGGGVVVKATTLRPTASISSLRDRIERA